MPESHGTDVENEDVMPTLRAITAYEFHGLHIRELDAPFVPSTVHCGLCPEPFGDSYAQRPRCISGIAGCRHVFHAECIFQYLTTIPDGVYIVECPVAICGATWFHLRRHTIPRTAMILEKEMPTEEPISLDVEPSERGGFDHEEDLIYLASLYDEVSQHPVASQNRQWEQRKAPSLEEQLQNLLKDLDWMKYTLRSWHEGAYDHTSGPAYKDYCRIQRRRDSIDTLVSDVADRWSSEKRENRVPRSGAEDLVSEFIK